MMGRGSVARGYPAAAAETVALAKAQEVGGAKVEVKAAGTVVLEGSSISEN